MFCTNCGSQVDPDSKVCPNCNTSLSGNSNPIQTENGTLNNNTIDINSANTNTSNNNNNNNANSNTTTVNSADVPKFNPTHSIILLLVSFLCCGNLISLIFSIIALVKGDDVNKLVAQGNISEAKAAKKSSDNWIKGVYIAWAVELGIIIICSILWLVLFLSTI